MGQGFQDFKRLIIAESAIYRRNQGSFSLETEILKFTHRSGTTLHKPLRGQADPMCC
jgi:hypothetical protein